MPKDVRVVHDRGEKIHCIDDGQVGTQAKNTGVVGRGKLTEVIRVMEREKSMVRVATELYYPRESVDKVKGALYKYLADHNEITAAIFRDILGSSRKYTIALLEYFDREGITVRIGDARRLKSPTSAGR